MSIFRINTKEIKEKVDVVALLELYGFEKIEDDGEWVKAVCQFHDDTNPSFAMKKSDTSFHCWSCKVGGDAIQLIMDLDSVDFKSALSKLAIITGYSLDSTEPDLEHVKRRWATEVKESRPNVALIEDARLFFLNSIAAQYFNSKLANGTHPYEYVINRGFSFSDMEQFWLGYCPTEGFYQHMRANCFSDEELVKSGLFMDNGYELYPKFPERLIFPIIDKNGEVRGFSARALKDGQLPKYINTANSEHYKKGCFLYGYNLVASNDPIVLVEGNLDCVRLRSNEVNAVAQLGSALSRVQCELLGNRCATVVLVYDGDDAGRKMAQSNIPIMIENSLKPKIVFLPKGEDPDTFVLTQGVDKLIKMVDNSEEGLSYYLTCLRQLGGDDVSILSLCLNMLSRTKHPLIKEYHVKMLSKLLPFSSELITAELKKV